MTVYKVPSTTDAEWQIVKAEHLRQLDLDSFADELLVTGCLAGDEEAWRVLIDRYGRLIYTVAYNFSFSTVMVEEVFQDVCLQMIQKMHTLQDRSKIRPWLVTITKRLCLHRKRKMNRVVFGSEYLEEIFADDSLLEETVLQDEAHSLIEQALSQLDDRCRYMIEALFLAEPKISYEEVAEHLEMSEGSVGPIRQRCLNKLRNLIIEIDGDTTRQR